MNIACYPSGSVSTASSRLRVYKVADALRLLGHEVHIQVVIPEAADVIVVQKRHDMMQQMSHWIAQHKHVIFDLDDWLTFPDLPSGVQVTVDTVAKLALYPRAVVVPDCLDVDSDSPFKTTLSDRLRSVVTVCNVENLYHITPALEACCKLGLELTVITNTNNPVYAKNYAYQLGVSGVAWSLDSVDAELVKHDLFIAPFVFDGRWSSEWVRSKSANRILKAWGLGLPVAATPIPAYTEVGLGYTAQTTDEWVEVLRTLQDPLLRQADAQRGYAVAQQFTADKVALQWLKVFEA